MIQYFQKFIMEKLYVPDLCKAFIDSTNRVILLDIDGTLALKKAEPDNMVTKILSELANTHGNRVVVISSHVKQTLDAWFLGLNLTVVAEHGSFLKEPGKEWQAFLSGSFEWKTKLISSLTALAFSYEGSYIEEKTFSVCWHYRQVAEKVQQQKEQILAGLRSLPFSKEFLIVDENNTIELLTHGISKGNFVSRWLSKLPYFDFFLAIGESETDEDIFALIDRPHYSVRVGKSNKSSARFYVSMHNEVPAVLQILVQISKN